MNKTFKGTANDPNISVKEHFQEIWFKKLWMLNILVISTAGIHIIFCFSPLPKTTDTKGSAIAAETCK